MSQLFHMFIGLSLQQIFVCILVTGRIFTNYYYYYYSV